MNHTTSSELLSAVTAFLRQDVLPQLEGFTAYNTRIAANSLGIVARELEHGAELAALDAEAAQIYSIDTTKGPVTQQLALALKRGELQEDPQLLNYLQQRTLKLLEIDNPKYSGFAEARKRWQKNQS